MPSTTAMMAIMGMATTPIQATYRTPGILHPQLIRLAILSITARTNRMRSLLYSRETTFNWHLVSSLASAGETPVLSC